MLLCNDKQQVVANGYPYLRVDSVLGGSVEGLDVKMLLDPLEEKFDLPSFAVQFRDGERVFNREVVGQEAIDLSSLKVLIHNESHSIRILSGRVISGKTNGLVGKNPRVLVNRPGLQNFVDHVVLGPRNEVSAHLPEAVVELLTGDISLVYQVERVLLDGDPVHYLGIVDLTGSKQNKGRDRASKIPQRMHLERAFPVMELGPWAQLQAQFNGTTVERIYHLFKTNSQLLVLVELLSLLDQNHRKVLIDTPILLLVGFRKRGFWHHLDSCPIPVATEVKCSLSISQTSSVGELSKAHHHELVMAIELDRVAVAIVAVVTLLELIFVDERHNLGEDCFSFVHSLRMAS